MTSDQRKNHDGKVVFMTGAGSGIGRATALAFAHEGASVVVADISEQGSRETARMIEELGGQAIAVKCDVSRVEDEKMNDLTRIAVGKPQLIKIVSNVESDISEEIAYTYHLLHTFAHVYHMHQRKVVSDNEWTGWVRRMRTCFEQGKIREYWEGDLELHKWFDPAFEDFINNEIVRKTSPKQKTRT